MAIPAPRSPRRRTPRSLTSELQLPRDAMLPRSVLSFRMNLVQVSHISRGSFAHALMPDSAASRSLEGCGPK